MSISSADDTEARRDALAVGLLRDVIPGLVAAYRFGSSAAGTGRPGSDVDLAILADQRLEPVARFNLQEQLASALRTDVDLVDLRAASTVMASQVVTTGILLYERDARPRTTAAPTGTSALQRRTRTCPCDRLPCSVSSRR